MIPKVVGYAADESGVGYYRIRCPLEEAARQRLIKLQSSSERMIPMRFIPNPDGHDAALCNFAERMYHEQGRWGQVLHSGRYANYEQQAVFRGMSLANGMPWILDVDDDVLHLDAANPAKKFYRHLSPEEQYDTRPVESPDECEDGEMIFQNQDTNEMVAVRQKAINQTPMQTEQLLVCDALSTTTSRLANVYRKMRRKKGKRPFVYILPNSLDPKVWDAVPPPADHGDEVWVGWAGSVSHAADVWMLPKIAAHVLTKYPHVRFVWTRLPNPAMMKLNRKYGQRCILVEGWAQIDEWPDHYKCMNLDIALGPLSDTRFNRAKSNLKWLEAGMLRQPFVCSDVRPYSETIRQGQDGFLCQRPEEWIRHVDTLIESRDARDHIGGTAHERVMTEFNMEKNAYLWRDMYVDVIEKMGDMAQDRTRKCEAQPEAVGA